MWGGGDGERREIGREKGGEGRRERGEGEGEGRWHASCDLQGNLASFPAFVAVQKNGERDFIMCAVTYYVWFGQSNYCSHMLSKWVQQCWRYCHVVDYPSAWCCSILHEGVLERPQQTTVTPDSNCDDMKTVVYMVVPWGKLQANAQASHTFHFCSSTQACSQSFLKGVSKILGGTKHGLIFLLINYSWGCGQRLRHNYSTFIA